MRTFSGADEFQKLSSTVVDAYKRLFPVEKNGHRIDAPKIWLDDKTTAVDDYADQKKVKLAGGTWGVPVMASLVLKDENGKVVDRIEKIRIATVPRLTPRHSYIVSGNEYQVANQMIRKPGTYVTASDKGDTYKGMVVTQGERQKNFDINFDSKTNRYDVVMGDKTKVGILPLLHSLGASDQEIIKTIGEDVFLANRKYDRDAGYHKLAKSIANVTTDNRQTAMDAVKQTAPKMKVDPGITGITLGTSHSELSKGLVLDTAKKILQVHNHKADPDDVENLVFKEVRSVEDMLHDKLTSKKETQQLKNLIGKHLGRRANLKKMIDFRKLTSPVEAFFKGDDRVNPPEQYNPINMLAGASKLTVMGTGGITQEHAVPVNLREVHPSHIGFVDPVHTPEADTTGLVLHMAAGVQKNGREINASVYNTKTKKHERLTPLQMFGRAVAFPDEIVDGKFKNPSGVKVQHRGKVMVVPSGKVDGVLATPIGLFSHSSNLVPFLKNNQGTRTAMAAKQLGQALPLINREAPHVQTELVKGQTFQEAIGKQFSVAASKNGTVKAIGPDYIQIDSEKIPLYNNFPLNQKTYIHHTPTVKVGDRVKAGQLIADSNFTKGGSLALGTNLKVAYLPIPGHTFEDGIVITESASKKLSAEQVIKHSFQPEAGRFIVNGSKWESYHGRKIPLDARNQLGENGVIKKGARVKPGDILIAGLANNTGSLANKTLQKLNKALAVPWADAAVKYTGEYPGIVTDVNKNSDGHHVYVKTIEPARESDKLSGVHGNKGVISKVIPDSEAPRTADGQVPDMFLNPHGVISRINLGQIYESAAGKIADKTGKPYVVKNFDSEPTNTKIIADLKKAGLTDTETLYDPKGNKLGEVSVGIPHIIRLAKTGKSGFSARTPGSGYDRNMQPLRRGESGTKSVDALAFYSMLSHGAKKNLHDAHMKSERNDELWDHLSTGKPLPPPKTTFAFDKFLGLLKGAGINVTKNGSNFGISPLTDKETLKLSNGAVDNWQFVRGKDMQEIKGGFFDRAKTGGLDGGGYTHIDLPERLPNPIFEGAIRNLTGLSKPQYNDLIAGKRFLGKDGKITDKTSPGYVTGGEAISHLLKGIDVEQEMKNASALLKSRAAKPDTKATEIDSLNRKVRYLAALKELNLKPTDAYTRSTVPVVPPKFRPIEELPGIGRSVSPSNYLYQGLGILAEAHKYPVMKYLDDSEKAQLRQETYKQTRVISGLEALYPRGKDQPAEGFLQQISNNQPKQGFFLNKLITKKQDLVGRGVITNGPDLHVDEIGIPEKMAWSIFKPFIVSEFVKAGYAPVDARQEVEKKTVRARQQLEAVMKKRTVMMNRAPSLHKFSIMAFKPQLTDGLAIKVPPLVFKGFNADIDGDAVNIHVPISQEALTESHKMLPSNNLWNPGTGELMLVPSQEAAIGLYLLSQNPEGRARINKLLPSGFHVTKQLNKAGAREFFKDLAKKEPNKFATLVQELKNLGDQHSYQTGFSASIKDLQVDNRERDRLFAMADRAVAALRKKEKAGVGLDAKISEIYEKAATQAYETSGKKQLKDSGSSFYRMVESGAKGNDLQLRQMVTAPGILVDSKNRKVPVPVKNSYAEGLTTSDYFIASYGVRKGMMDRTLQTSKPGALNKDILAATVDNIITVDDCGTKKGLKLPLDRTQDIYDRYLSRDQHGYARNTLVTPQVLSSLRKKGAKTVDVRTPLECIAPKGTCARCFGIDEHGAKPSLGDNIGAKMGQAMSEPVTQFTMRTFHTGGVAGAATVSGFNRVNQLVNQPAHLAREATMATNEGKVSKITKAPAGGHVIEVGDKRYTTHPDLKLNVRVGDRVKVGDNMTEGVTKPQNLARYKGLDAAQNYIVDELQNTYAGQGVNMHRRVFETVVRSVANNTQVLHAPKHMNVLPGDVMPYTTAKHYNEQRAKKVHVEDSAGYHLQNNVGKLPALHEIQDKDIPYLKAAGFRNEIDVLKDPLLHKPMIKAITEIPFTKKNWMAQLGYRKIKNTLTEGAAQNWSSDVADNHPIPAFAHGASFGKKKETY
jgi:DNA-directed RNA polymerase subunit beta'